MKKALIFACLTLLSIFSLCAEKFKIKDAKINTSGKYKFATTKPYAVEIQYPIDKKTLFTEESLTSYLAFYKQQLINSRYFEEVNVTYETASSDEGLDENSITEVIVLVDLKDSNHFLAVPYPTFKDDINELSITPKLKTKDTNFLGTLTPLAFDLNIEIVKNKDEDFFQFNPGMNISYDMPFKFNHFNLTWVNDYSLSYTFGNDTPEWDAKTGLEAEVPFNRFSLIAEFYQYSYRELKYRDYNDDLYFAEEFDFSVPIKVYKFKNFTNLVYKPSVGYSWNWDFDGINPENDSLSSPKIYFKHSISNSQINWKNNFRKGYSVSLSNKWNYNFQRKDLSPSITFESKLYTNYILEDRNYLDIAGICADLYSFWYFDAFNSYYDNSLSGYGEGLGNRLRGIPNNFYFGNESPSHTTSAAIVLNLDFPVDVYKTNFKHDILNFDLQLSPFMDIAIFRDRALPLQTNSAICIGGEALVYPKKWSSFTIRVSLGVDMKAAAAEPNFIKGALHNKELFIGLGLAY